MRGIPAGASAWLFAGGDVLQPAAASCLATTAVVRRARPPTGPPAALPAAVRRARPLLPACGLPTPSGSPAPQLRASVVRRPRGARYP
jgi:hypothetical protein